MKKIICFITIFMLFSANLRFFHKTDTMFSVATSAEGVAVIETSSGRLLYSKDENKRLSMASTTKILTAIVAIENTDDLNEKHEIPKQAVGIEGSSIYLKAGEHLSILELLYGLMLRSGNDAAVAIAIIVSGSVENFVKLMNGKCKDLDLANTHIVTVNGLHDDKHFTTAHELAKITAYALQNEIFAKIVSTKEVNISNEKGKTDKRYLRNKNRFLNMVDGADGVKTGYTKKAGRCLVSSATRNGMQVVCVVLNCVPMFEDSSKLVSNAFDEYKLVKLFSKGEILKIDSKDKKSQKVPVLLKNDIYFPLKTDEIVKITAKLNIKHNLQAPITDSEPIGTIDVNLENNLIFSNKVYTINIDKTARVKDNFHKIIKAF